MLVVGLAAHFMLYFPWEFWMDGGVRMKNATFLAVRINILGAWVHGFMCKNVFPFLTNWSCLSCGAFHQVVAGRRWCSSVIIPSSSPLSQALVTSAHPLLTFPSISCTSSPSSRASLFDSHSSTPFLSLLLLSSWRLPLFLCRLYSPAFILPHSHHTSHCTSSVKSHSHFCPLCSGLRHRLYNEQRLSHDSITAHNCWIIQ